MSNQIVISSGAKVRNLSGVLTGTAGIVNALGINVPSGIPQLDGSGKILVSQLPNSVMEYKGTWNAATNTPTLANGTGNQGDVYLCNVAGTVDFGAGPIVFFVGDQVIYSGTIWQRASGSSGTVTSVAVTETGDALTITGSPITTSGTINIGFAGTSGQYVNGAGGLTTFPSLTGYVPYTGATANVDLGTFDLTADIVNANDIKALTSAGLDIYSNSGTHIALMGGGGGAGTTFYGGIVGTTGSFASSGGSDTFAINHSSGSGIALNITKGGNNEGLYINKTSGSGNAATIIGTLNATTLVKSGGTSSEFLKADGSVDSSTYLTTSSAASTYVPYTGATNDVNLGTQTLSSSVLFVNGNNTSTFGYLGFKQFSGGSSGFNGYTSIFAQSTNTLGILFSQSAGVIKQVSFITDLLQNNVPRNYNFPDADGTIALTSNLSAYLPLTGGTLSGQLSILRGSGTGLDVASDLVIFRASTGFGSPRQITLAAGNGATTYLEAKGYGANYITDFGIRTYNSSGTAFEVFFATSAGDVGIGNTAPAAKLDVNGTGRFTSTLTANGGLRTTGANGYLDTDGTSTIGLFANVSGSVAGLITTTNHPIGFWTNNTERMRILTNGNVGIGMSSPSGILELKSSAATNSVVFGIVSSNYNVFSLNGTNVEGQYIGLAGGGGTDKNLYYQSGDGGTHIFRTGDGSAFTERMKITSGGALQMINNSTTFSIGSIGGVIRIQWDSGTEFAFLNASNAYAPTGASAFNVRSDYRLKEDLKEVSGLDKVLAIKTYDFKWIDSELRQDGVLAHELQEVLPYAVSGVKDQLREDGTIYPQGVDYGKLVPILVKAIQEQQAQIEELKAKIK